MQTVGLGGKRRKPCCRCSVLVAVSNSGVEAPSQRRRCRGSGEAGGGTSRRWQRPLSRLARVRSVGGVSGGAGEPRALCSGPTSFL